MSAKHYIAIGEVLAYERTQAEHDLSVGQSEGIDVLRARAQAQLHTINQIGDKLASVFEKIDPKFDRVKFAASCGE